MAVRPFTATSIDVIAEFLPGARRAAGRWGASSRRTDARNGAAPVVLLTNAWWKRQFNGDPNIVGKAFDMNGQQTTVIGVLPESFDFGAVFSPGAKVDAITPLNLYGPPRDWGNIITLIGRLKPGVTLAQAPEMRQRAWRRTCAGTTSNPQSCGDYKGAVVPVPLKDYVSGKLRRSLVVLWCGGRGNSADCVRESVEPAAGARCSAHQRSSRCAGALGASRGRIVRQLLTESLVLSGAGAMLGLVLACSSRLLARAPGRDCIAAAEHAAHRRRRAGVDAC